MIDSELSLQDQFSSILFDDTLDEDQRMEQLIEFTSKLIDMYEAALERIYAEQLKTLKPTEVPPSIVIAKYEPTALELAGEGD